MLPRRQPAARAHAAHAVCALLAALGCSGTPEIDPRYRPSESVLEVLAVLQRHVPDDTYRFPPARDFTGRNVYRSSLLRLENLEQIHANALRAGHMDGAIAFGKGRSLERLRAYDLAAEAYRIAAERDATLAAEALRSAELCDDLERASEIQIEPVPIAGQDTEFLEIPSPALALARFEERAALLEALAIAAGDSHQAAIVREEIERNDLERARYFVRVRSMLVDGDVRAAAELERVITLHTESKLSARHLLDLAEFYAQLSAEYVGRHPPESLDFDPAEFRDLVDSSARLYEMVAARDGTTEKIEATRRLEAFLAFALGVDRDRFTP
jgi:hypothetical protein